MLDHVTIGVSDLLRAKAFYDRALQPLGLACLYEEKDVAGYGSGRKPFFWIGLRPSVTDGVHIAFAAPDHVTVDAFHAAALTAGSCDNGPPGLRPHYHPGYYGAFVLDPDGHNVEAVCHGAGPQAA